MANFLSSNFLTPVFFGFLLLIPVVVVLYLLKLRRTEIVIASTFLWMKSLQDLTANAPFQRLRKNLLLLLQIIVLLLLVISLARPFVRTEGIEGSSYCVIIDNSASMQTVEQGTNRLELAKDVALEMVDTLGRGDRMMVVSFAESANVVCELTDDRYRLRKAIGSIGPTDTRTKIRDVMFIARSLAPDNPDIASVVSDLELVLLSDGKLSDAEEVGARVMKMTYVRIGESRNNAGIVGLSVRRSPEGEGSQQTFALVHNEGAEELNATLSLYFEDSLLVVEEVVIPGGERKEILFAHPDLGSGVLRVELDHEDDLAIDNRAWLSLHPASTVRTLIVTDGESTSGYFLKRALGLESRVELSAVQPEDYVPTSDYDLVIFDGHSPESLPSGTLLFFNALPDLPGLATDGVIEQPPVISKDSEHPVMRFLSPGNVGIVEAHKLILPEGARALLSTTGSALIADVSRGGQQILVVGFDVANSGWPLELSFPLFIQNVVSWAPRAAGANEMWLRTGSPITLPASLEEVAEITTPGGVVERVELDPVRPVYFAATAMAGVYSVVIDGETTRHALNLLSETESSIGPSESLEFGRTTMTATKGPVKRNREMWRWFVLAAVAVLMGEWWIYTRRAWI